MLLDPGLALPGFPVQVLHDLDHVLLGSGVVTIGLAVEHPHGHLVVDHGLDLFLGHTGTALLHLGSFALAVAGLAITALFTFFIYNAKFGRTPLREVHKQQAVESLEELDYEVELTDKKAAAN